MSFARKAIHWDRDDVKDAAAVLREDLWNVEHSVKRVRHEREANGSWIRDEYVIEEDNRPIAKLLVRLGKDYSAAESLLIFVNEFRCLIEGESDAKDMSNLSSTVQGTTNWSQDMQQS